ncbi:hypothetical protein D3C74_466980 [compost metagenome]
MTTSHDVNVVTITTIQRDAPRQHNYNRVRDFGVMVNAIHNHPATVSHERFKFIPAVLIFDLNLKP